MRITPSNTISSRPSADVLCRRLLPLLSGLILVSLPSVAQESAPAPAAPATAASAAPKPQVVLPDGEGKDIVAKKCTVCHTPVRIVQSARSEDEWRDLVQTMVDRGADVSPEEAETVVKYLSKNFPPKTGGAGAAAPAAGTTAPAAAAAAATSTPAGATTTSEEVAAAGVPSAAGKINLNTAGSAELKSTLGLTEQEAEGIIQYRQQSGSFKSWDDVAKVPGLSKKSVDAIKDRATFQ